MGHQAQLAIPEGILGLMGQPWPHLHAEPRAAAVPLMQDLVVPEVLLRVVCPRQTGNPVALAAMMAILAIPVAVVAEPPVHKELGLMAALITQEMAVARAAAEAAAVLLAAIKHLPTTGRLVVMPLRALAEEPEAREEPAE